MYTLEEIFDQAWSDNASAKAESIDGDRSAWYNGVKMVEIKQDPPRYTLENTGTPSEYYIELNDNQVDVFIKKGWRQGCYNVAIENHEKFIARMTKTLNKYDGGKESIIKSYEKQLEDKINKLNQIKEKL